MNANLDAAAGFATSANDDDENTSNAGADSLSKLLSTAFKLGKEQGKGDGARLEVFDLVRTGTLEGTIKYEAPPKGRPAKGVVDNSHVAQVAARFLAGVVKAGGNESKATQKSRLNAIAAWCDGPDTREQDATWAKVVARHKVLDDGNKVKGATKVPIYALGEVMLRVANKYGTKVKLPGHDKAVDLSDRSTPLDDAEIDEVIKRSRVSRDFLDIHKAYMTKLLEVIDEEGGDEAAEEYKKAAEAGGKLTTLLTNEYEADADERNKKQTIERLVAQGVLVPSKNGRTFRYA